MPAIAHMARSYSSTFASPSADWLRMPLPPARFVIEKSLQPASHKACALPPVARETASMNGDSAKTPLDQGSIPDDGNMPSV